MGSPAAHLGRVCITPYDVVRIVLGLILLSAAALKGHQLASEPVAETSLFTSRWFLICVVELELFFGLWLLCGLCSRRTWQAALLCFSAFACVSLYKALSGEATCGCFGRVPVNPWYTFVVDLAAVTALLGFRPVGELETSLRPVAGERPGVRGRLGTRLGWVLGLFLAAGIPAALAMGSYDAAALGESGDILGDGEFVLLEPEGWVGKRFPLLECIDVGGPLAHGEWVVVLYREGCPHCEQAIPKYEQLAEDYLLEAGAPQIALVEVPRVDGRASPGRGSVCVQGRLPGGKAWFVETPLEIRLEEGMVVQIIHRF